MQSRDSRTIDDNLRLSVASGDQIANGSQGAGQQRRLLSLVEELDENGTDATGDHRVNLRLSSVGDVRQAPTSVRQQFLIVLLTVNESTQKRNCR